MKFIASDDPVVFTSMFHAKKQRTDRFGFASTSDLFFLPLYPKLLLLCYDGDAYTLSGKSHGVISLSNVRDVRACNELQFLNAAHAVYFSDWSHRCDLMHEFNTVSSCRKSFCPEFSTFIPEGTVVDGQLYRKLDQKRNGN